jgi:hypothetical protein
MKDTWEEYSRYILITLEKLIKNIEETNKEHQKCKEKTLDSLNNLKIMLLEKIQDASLVIKKDMEPVVKKLEIAISNINNDFLILKENTILPLRIKVAVISIIGGAAGGVLVTLVMHLLFSGV